MIIRAIPTTYIPPQQLKLKGGRMIVPSLVRANTDMLLPCIENRYEEAAHIPAIYLQPEDLPALTSSQAKSFKTWAGSITLYDSNAITELVVIASAEHPDRCRAAVALAGLLEAAMREWERSPSMAAKLCYQLTQLDSPIIEQSIHNACAYLAHRAQAQDIEAITLLISIASQGEQPYAKSAYECLQQLFSLLLSKPEIALKTQFAAQLCRFIALVCERDDDASILRRLCRLRPELIIQLTGLFIKTHQQAVKQGAAYLISRD